MEGFSAGMRNALGVFVCFRLIFLCAECTEDGRGLNGQGNCLEGFCRQVNSGCI